MAFIVIAVICGMVIGHALVSQALPAPWLRAASVVPGSVFGPGGEGYVRFALIENEQRIGQAVRNLKKALTKLS